MWLRCLIGFGLALMLTGAMAGSFGQRMERGFGLGLLYAIRGDVPAPKEALIIALDSDTIGWLQRNVHDLSQVSEGLDTCLTPHALDVLEQSRNVNLVPRALYICLLARLEALSPHTVVIDVKFNAERPDDEAFAEAIRRMGNVLLLEGIGGELLITRSLPAEVLANAAAGSAVFQADGVDGRITTGYAARIPEFPDAQTMPVAAWRRFTGGQIPASGSLQPVWFYGPPQSVSTLPLRQIFERGVSALPQDLSRSVVFVGVSDDDEPSAQDHFRMPMPLGDPAMIAGVEIAATAFLNLLHDERLSRPPGWVWGLTTLGILAMMVVAALCIGGVFGVFLPLATGVLYLAGAAVAFTHFQIWLPVFAPVLVGLPVALISGQLLRYSLARDIIRRLVPHQVAEKWLSETRLDVGTGGLEDATIVFIDLVGSTSIAEQHDPKSLERILSVYYDGAAQAIESRGGMITEFKGDGVLAIFSESVAGAGHARLACNAAADVSMRVRQGCREDLPEIADQIRMRFGIHTGQVATGVIGSRDRFNFNALGDSMNVAARIEQFGKTVPESREDVILLSGETMDHAGLPDHAIQFIDRVKLRGRRETTEILRLIAPPD